MLGSFRWLVYIMWMKETDRKERLLTGKESFKGMVLEM